ncbi:hypothetical protein [Streptacidiphilus sp. P02-A3a]|uniref:hypothetical protein n=1 Tax=Streptacidiphilus sp. P02-A3a TaxID=2704468 RepID=UPI0015FB4A67|nr:hypothetical protein [Streptacidiphilus sp. P02-A3a]QMU71167.1 hypothetical protein GXP74_26060 [Streptacidiphilus sp. P02-A3a]
MSEPRPMIRVHVLRSRRADDGEPSVRIRISWYAEEVTTDADEVRRTALALLRARWWLDAHQRLTAAGLSDERAAGLLGPLPTGTDGTEGPDRTGNADDSGFRVSIGPGGSVRLARPGIRIRALIPRAEVDAMATGWLRIAESAEADLRLLQALRHTTELPQARVDDLFAYLWVLRSDDPLSELDG